MLSKKERLEIALILLCVPVLILGFVVSLSVYNTKKNGTVPTVLGYSFLTVVSGSMEPELMVGTSFICKAAKAGEVEVGDIISFKRGNMIVTHKVAEIYTIQKNGQDTILFQTYGINNKKAGGDYIMDSFWVEETQLIGIYAGSTSLNGFVGFFVSSWGMFCFVIIPLGFIILSDILSLISYIKPKEKAQAAITELPLKNTGNKRNGILFITAKKAKRIGFLPIKKQRVKKGNRGICHIKK